MFDLIIFILSICAQLFFGKKVCKLNPAKVLRIGVLHSYSSSQSCLRKVTSLTLKGHFVVIVSFR